jgi:site-specific recombinase XerD
LRRETPFAQVLESFFIHNGMAPKTKDFYRGNFNAYGEWLRSRIEHEPTLADLNADYVSAFLRDLEVTPTKRYPQGSPFRSRAACKSLKRLANWLAEERVLKESPLERIKKAPEPKEVRQPLSDQELEQVRFAAGRSGSRDHALVVFMAGTGLRLNEARQLRIADLNLGACQVTVRAMTSKRKKTRVVDFHSAVAREMERYLRTRHDAADTDPLFPTDEGRFFTVDGFGKLFARISKKSSVRRFHAHLLRHTWATNWMKGPGADLLSLQRQGGWERLEMVERYSHAVPIRDRAALPNPLASATLVHYPRDAKAV